MKTTLGLKRKLIMNKMAETMEGRTNDGMEEIEMTLVERIISAMADCRAPAWSQYPRR